MEDGMEVDEEEDINLEILIRGFLIILNYLMILFVIVGVGVGFV